MPPSKPGLTAVANTAAPHHTFEGGSSRTSPARQMERVDPDLSSVQTYLVKHCALSDDEARALSDEDVRTLLDERQAASEERSTIWQAELRRQARYQEEICAPFAKTAWSRKRKLEAGAAARSDTTSYL